MSGRDLLRQLAKSPKVAAGARAVAEQIRAEASGANHHGNYRITQSMLNVDGLPRVAFLVFDDADGAPGWEFGNTRQKPKRALGKAAAKHRG